jgi:hypothetical protein
MVVEVLGRMGTAVYIIGTWLGFGGVLEQKDSGFNIGIPRGIRDA